MELWIQRELECKWIELKGYSITLQEEPVVDLSPEELKEVIRQKNNSMGKIKY